MRQSDLSPPPDATGQKSDARRDWPEFVDDDEGTNGFVSWVWPVLFGAGLLILSGFFGLWLRVVLS